MVKVAQTVEPTVKTTVDNTPNAEGYVKTNKKYGDYFNDDERKNNLDIYKKDGKSYYKGTDGKYNEIVHTTGQSLQPAPTQVKETEKEKTNATINFDNKKELKYQPKEKEEEKLSPINQIKLDTEDLTKEEKKKYKKSLLQQEEQEREKSNFVRRSGTGIDALTGAYGNVFENPNNPIQKEIAKPLENAERIYESGKLNNKLALEWYKKAQGKSNNVEEIEKEIQKFNNFNQDIASGNVGWLGESIQNANTQVESLKNQGIAATGGAILGGGLGALVGLKTGDVAGGALKGSKLGAKAGYAFGSTPYMYKLEYGNSYKDMKELGVSDKKAKNVATAVASINSAIESGENIVDLLSFSGAGKLASSEVKGQVANKMADDFKDIIEDLGEEKAKSYIARKFGPEVAEQVFKTYTKNVTSESLEEGSQELTSILGERYATKSEGINRGISVKEDAESVGKSALAGGSSALAFGIPTSLVGNATSYVSGKTQNAINNMKQQNNINTQDSINTQQKAETKPTIEESNQIKAQQLNQIEQDVKTGTITPEQGQVALQQVQTIVEPQTIETKPVAKLTQQEQQELDILKDLPFDLDEQQERRMDELLLKQNKDLEKNMSPVRNLSDVRDFNEVGSKKVNAYQYDNPEVKPYFQEVAKDMLYDLDNSTKGERYMTEDGQFKGVKRNVPNDIAELLDGENGVKYSYKEIEDGLNAIIKDNGAENKAVAKRLEFYIDQRLRNGYMDSIAGKIPANNEYIETLRNKNAGENPNIAAEMEKENLLKVTPKTLEPKTQEINNYLKENVPLKQGEAYSRTPQTAVNSMRLYENSPEISDFKRETLTHIVATDKAAKIDASEKYKENGSLENNAAYVRGLLQSDKRLTKNDKALAIYTMNEALKQGNKEVADNIISDLTVLDVEAGQWSQASKLMKQMTPLGQLETFIKMVQRSIDKGNPRFKNVKITQDMIDDVMDSYTDGKFDNDKFAKKMENFKQQVQEQMTPTLMDKFNSARMLGMLGAPKTHIRNLLANVGGVGLRISKNFNDRVAETIFIRDQSKRTHTFKRATPEIKSFVDEVVKSEKDTISGDKYTNNKLDFQKNMKIFNDKHKGLFKIVNPISKAMNGLSKGNSWLLEAEDTLFSSFAYKRSLQEFLTAQGMKTREDVQNNPKILAKGKDYALQQALESTYRQDSNLASAISNYVKKAESSKGSKLDKAAGIVIESNLPFKKTPINIAKSGIEYSPIGLVNGIYDTLANVSNGNMEMSQAIDEISKGVTGLGLLGIGALLAHNGFEIGAADDDDKDKKKTYDKLLGEQEYSVKIGDKYYDLSWMSPSAMPFFTGVELYQSLVKEKKLDGNAVIDILSKTIDPLSSMSFLQGLSYTLKSYADSPGEFFSTLGLSAVENYVSQYLPTFLSQIASFTDSKQRTTSTSGDSSFSEGEKLLNQLKLKVPGARKTLPAKTDSWGRDLKNETYKNLFNAFINPANTKTDLKDKTDKELERLYYSIGADDKLSSSALPKVKFDKYLTFKGEKYNLSNKELSEYKKTYGKIAKQNVEALLQTDEYKSADDRQKAKYLESIYDYSNQKAKEQYGEKHNLDYDDYKVDQLYALVDAFDIPLEVAVTNKNIMDLKAEDGISGTKRKIAAVDDIDELDEIQKDALKRKFTMFMGNSSYKKRYDGTDVSYALNDALDYSDVSNDKINEIKRFLNIG